MAAEHYDHAVNVDHQTFKRIECLASDMGMSMKEIVRRAIDVLATARTVAKGHEIDSRNKSE